MGTRVGALVMSGRAARHGPTAAQSSAVRRSTPLEGIADAYAAMDERRTIKSLVRVGSL